jgi:hypothetical protein
MFHNPALQLGLYELSQKTDGDKSRQFRFLLRVLDNRKDRMFNPQWVLSLQA